MQNASIKPLAQFVFKPSSWLAQIESINQLLGLDNRLIAILSEAASGKSTFLAVLQAELDATYKAHFIKASSFSETEFLRELAEAFDLAPGKLANLVAEINEKKAPLLLIIDDAHQIPESFIQEMLAELKNQGPKGFFHLCLAADSSLFKVEDELLHVLQPGNLTPVETKTYLRSVIPESESLAKLLTDSDFEAFYELTQGNLARINAQKTKILKPAPMNSSQQRRYLLRGFSYLATVVLAVAISFYIGQNRFLPSSKQEEPMEDFTVLAEILQPLPSLVPIVPKFKQILVSELPDIHQFLLAKGSKIPPFYLAVIKQQVQPSPKRIVDIKLEEENDSSLVVRDRVVVIPKTLAKVAQNTSKGIPEQAAIKDNFYTIQLLASPRKSDLKRFAKNNQLGQDAKINLTKRQGLVWYILTLGEYSQLRQAEEAVKTMAPNLARYHPWIRPIAEIRALG